MNDADNHFEAWLQDNVGYVDPYELRTRDFATAQVFLRDRLNAAFRVGYEMGAKGEQAQPKPNTPDSQGPPDPVALRMQVQAELRQAKAQLRALETAYRSLSQDLTACQLELMGKQG